jgi:zinc D-Ala-D-Ala carboxypeptidase
MPYISKKKLAQLVLSVTAGTVIIASAGCRSSGPPEASASPSAGAPSSSATAAPSAGKNGPVDSIAFDSKAITVPPGQTRTVPVKGLNAKQEPTAIPDAKSVLYTSDKPDIVAVDAGGAVKPGPKGITGASAVITASYKWKTASVTVTVKYALEETVKTIAGQSIVTDPEDIAVVINKKRGLPDNYEPTDLVEPKVEFSFSGKNEKRMLRKEAAAALEKLFKLAADDGIELYGVSGYRSRATQVGIYNGNVQIQGQEAADKVSARPGYSEHQTGLAIDVSSKSAKLGLEEVFGATKEGRWLAEHAHEAGFIIRYPKGKESITGYSYEPWHIRYVGEDMAKEIYTNKWTLEEYFQDAVPVNG